MSRLLSCDLATAPLEELAAARDLLQRAVAWREANPDLSTEGASFIAALGEPPVEHALCGNCGQLRPYPSAPGEWEYLEQPALAAHMQACTGQPHHWVQVTVVPDPDEEGRFNIIPLGKKKPVWWPSSAMWRRRKKGARS